MPFPYGRFLPDVMNKLSCLRGHSTTLSSLYCWCNFLNELFLESSAGDYQQNCLYRKRTDYGEELKKVLV